MRSGFENRIAKQLKQIGVDYKYEYETFEYWLPVYKAVCESCGETKQIVKRHHYTPDFFLSNGVVLEVKGRFTAKDRKIQAAMREYHPDVDLRMVFYADNLLRKNAKTRYSDWCQSKGIDYCFKEVPEEWTQ